MLSVFPQAASPASRTTSTRSRRTRSAYPTAELADYAEDRQELAANGGDTGDHDTRRALRRRPEWEIKP
jgi:hypothetical protein